jgi:hypothetical protein
MCMTSFAVAEVRSDDRDYDNWLATLTQASARLDILQAVVAELCQLCENEDVVQSQQVLAVLKGTARSARPLIRAPTPPN